MTAPLTPEERADWAYGNAVLSNPNVTREMAEKAAGVVKTAPVAALRALVEKAEYQRNHDARPDGRTHCAACLTNNEHQEIVDMLPALLRRLDRAEAVEAALVRLMEALPPGQKWVDAMRNAVERLAAYRAEEVG